MAAGSSAYALGRSSRERFLARSPALNTMIHATLIHNDADDEDAMSTQLVALTPALAARLARLALEGVTREYPNSPAHMLPATGNQRTPCELHPRMSS